MIDGIRKNNTFEGKFSNPAPRAESPAPKSEPRVFVNNSHVSYLRTQRWYVLLGILIASLVIAIVIASVTGHVNVSASPHRVNVPISGTKNLTKDAPAGMAGFHLVVLPVTKTEKVSAVTMQEVSTKATGSVVLFNEGPAQSLKERTRLEAPNGKIYYILKDQPFTVPAGTKEKPGSLEVTIEAAEAGADYNQSPTDFVIPGWREAKSPKFKTQYARSKSPITGGGSGMQPTVSADEKTMIHDKLVERIRVEGSELIRRHINEDYLLVDGSIQYSFADLKVEKRSDSETAHDAVLTGAVYAYVVSKDEFVHDVVATAGITLPDVRATYTVSDTSTATLALQSQSQTDPTQTQTIQVVQNGTLDAYAVIDTKTLGTQLAGKRFADLKAIFAAKPTIEGAIIKLRPFWMPKIPKNEAKIHVKTAAH